MGMNRKYARWELKSKRMEARKAKADAKARKAEAEAAKAESAAMERMARAEAKRDRTSRHGMRYSSTKDKTPTTKESHWEFGLFKMAYGRKKPRKGAEERSNRSDGRSIKALHKAAGNGGKRKPAAKTMSPNQQTLSVTPEERRRNKKFIDDLVVEGRSEKVRVKGRTYRIPVDDDGYVRPDAIAARFLAIGEGTDGKGKRNVRIDTDITASEVVPLRCRPEEIKRWWDRPNLLDVQDIDTEGADIFDVRNLKRKGSKEAQGKVAVFGDKGDREKVRRTIEDSFTVKEQKALVEDAGITVTVKSLPADRAAQYRGMDNGMSYAIDVDPKTIQDPDSLLHELVHHSRLVDKNREGILTKSRSQDGREIKMRAEDLALEEAATVSETLTRMTPYRKARDASYHGLVGRKKGKDPFRLIEEDRRLFVGSSVEGEKGFRGKKALKSVERNFEDSHIKDLTLPQIEAMGIKETAGDRYRQLREADKKA